MGLPSRSIHLAACALAAGALLTGLVPASGALAAPVAPTVRAAAEDPPTEDMPDDGFDDEHEGEQDDLVGPGGTASGQRAPGVRAAPVPGRAGDFRLAAGSDLSGLVGRLDAALPKQGLTALMEQANRTAGWEAACGNTSIYGPDLAVNHRVCWADDDLASTEWVPQAITGVSDAQEDEDWGTSNAEPIAVASYDAKNPGRSDQASGSQNCVQPAASDACNEKGVRVSFFNQATQKYRHVLLVWPYVNSKNNISFDALHASEGTCTGTVTPSCKAQNGIHAGGMVWYGNYLYVADTANGMRVFDLRKIMDLNPDNDADRNDPTPDGLESDVKDKKRIGRQNNVWYSFGYRYVMPQVATLKFTTAKNGGTTAGNQCYATGRPKALVPLPGPDGRRPSDPGRVLQQEQRRHQQRARRYVSDVRDHRRRRGRAGHRRRRRQRLRAADRGHVQQRDAVAQDPGRPALRGHVVLPPLQRLQQRPPAPGHPGDRRRDHATGREHHDPPVVVRTRGPLPGPRARRRLRPAALVAQRARPQRLLPRLQAGAVQLQHERGDR
ncbi:hypothetical protein [Streptomyces sp. CBG30]|uniref:hypothetical protein n=1 Tax=Streptomyces sp. CBG30 TaxID=2838869 RepID=UPI001BE8E213|nr:hypothetical protein [Streptomyces sp. CBG30]MBT3097147.1 hypothetical protein [Streptomyces sp. CBG30]